MKKFLLFSTLSFLFIIELFSQKITSNSSADLQQIADITKIKVLDTCVFSILYRMSTVYDVQKPEMQKENFMSLQIGKRLSKFSDYHRLMADSLRNVYAGKKMSMIEATNKLLPMLKGTTPLNVFKNYPAYKVTVTDRVPLSGDFKYIEDKEQLLWKLTTGVLTICGYKCKKATTTFRGRNYTAWYAPEIAIDEGPWKFWGLPGLILKVEDDEGHYSFECIAFEKAHSITPIYILDRTYMDTTKEKLDKALRDFHANPGASVINSGMIQSPLPASASKARPYNPIELSE